MKVQLMTLEQLAEFEKVKAEFAERTRRAELFPDLIIALERIVANNPDRAQAIARAALARAKAEAEHKEGEGA